MTDARSPAVEYLRFLAWVAGMAVLAALVGALPTRWLGGEAALAAMVAVAAGCAISAVASAAGGIMVARSRGTTDPAGRLNAMLTAMALRLGVLAALGGAAALSGWFERKPLLLWIGISHLVLLVVDTRYAVKGF